MIADTQVDGDDTPRDDGVDIGHGVRIVNVVNSTGERVGLHVWHPDASNPIRVPREARRLRVARDPVRVQASDRGRAGAHGA